MTLSESCLIKLLPCILFEKYIDILALEMASSNGASARRSAANAGSVTLTVELTGLDTDLLGREVCRSI